MNSSIIPTGIKIPSPVIPRTNGPDFMGNLNLKTLIRSTVFCRAAFNAYSRYTGDTWRVLGYKILGLILTAWTHAKY